MTPVQVHTGLMSIGMTPMRIRTAPMSIRSTPVQIGAGPMSFRLTPVQIGAGPMSMRSTPVRTDTGLRSIDATPLQTRMGRLQTRLTPGVSSHGTGASPRSVPGSSARVVEGVRWKLAFVPGRSSHGGVEQDNDSAPMGGTRFELVTSTMST